MRLIYIASAKSIHSLRWIKFFSQKYKISWITTSTANKETIKEFSELNKSVEILNLSKARNFIRIIKILLFEKGNVIHLHYLGWHSLIIGILRSSSKLILTPWGSDLLINNSFLKKIWLSYLFKRSSYTICDSERLKNISRDLGAKVNKIKICMFGIDTKIYKSSRPIFSNKRKITIGSNRKLEKIYDIQTLIKAAESICKLRDDIEFLVAGDGSQSDFIKNLVNQSGLNKKVLFLGLLNKKEMLNFYKSIDIYISTSLSDGGLSSSIAEAMSFQRLVIVTSNSDNKLWIEEGKNGYLFKNGDSKKLSLILKKVLDNKDKSILISKSARSIIKDKFSYQKEMFKVDKIYKELFLKN